MEIGKIIKIHNLPRPIKVDWGKETVKPKEQPIPVKLPQKVES
jgi:hypothetical protein